MPTILVSHKYSLQFTYQTSLTYLNGWQWCWSKDAKMNSYCKIVFYIFMQKFTFSCKINVQYSGYYYYWAVCRNCHTSLNITICVLESQLLEEMKSLPRKLQRRRRTSRRQLLKQGINLYIYICSLTIFLHVKN